MRLLTLLSSLILSPSLIGLAHSRPAPEPTIIDLEPVRVPGATFFDEVYIVGDEKTTLVVSMGRNEERPAIWRAFDAKGRERWRREHACPDFSDYAELRFEGGLATCKMSFSLTAFDVASGAERWSFLSPRPLYMNDIEAGRVAISVMNQELAVLDARTGRTVLRIDTPGAVFQRLASTPSGPFAVLLQDPPGRVERSIDLDLGDGPRRVVVAEPDAERRMVAVPVGGTASGLVAMKPVWAVPFEGYSFKVEEAAGALIGEPSEGLRVAWDALTGAQLWTAKIKDDELAAFGRLGGVATKHTPEGWSYQGFAPRADEVQWSVPVPTEMMRPDTETPLFVRVGGTRGAIAAPRVIRLISLRDGATELPLEVPDGYEVTAAHLSDNLLVYVTTREGSQRLHLVPLTSPRANAHP